MNSGGNILCGDAISQLRTLPDGCANMCVTSPPYYGLRDYGTDGQIGLESAPQEYVSRLTDVFREVRRVLSNDGVLFLNIADSYAGSGKGADDRASPPKNKQNYLFTTKNPAANIPTTWDGIKPKDMIGIPWALAFSLRADGWYLRSDIIWHKTNAMPHSVKDRPVSSYEHVFLLSKTKRYFYNYTALEEPTAESTKQRKVRHFGSEEYANSVPCQVVQPINKQRNNEAVADTRRMKRVIYTRRILRTCGSSTTRYGPPPTAYFRGWRRLSEDGRKLSYMFRRRECADYTTVAESSQIIKQNQAES